MQIKHLQEYDRAVISLRSCVVAYACMRISETRKKKCAPLAPPVDSYGPLPEHRAAEREGHSQISRFLPAESAVLLPHHGRQQSETATTTTTTCAQRASTTHSFQLARGVPDPPRPGRGEYIDTTQVSSLCFRTCLVHDREPRRSVSQARLVNAVWRRRRMRPVFRPDSPPPSSMAGNIKPGRHSGGSVQLSASCGGRERRLMLFFFFFEAGPVEVCAQDRAVSGGSAP